MEGKNTEIFVLRTNKVKGTNIAYIEQIAKEFEKEGVRFYFIITKRRIYWIREP